MRGAKIMHRLKVLICDDSAFLRVTLRKIIESDPALRVIDIARNGAEAVEKAIRLKPDVITMDLHMPVIDGITALKDIVELRIAPVIMLASGSNEDAKVTMDAMDAGAFDFIFKPGETDSLINHSTFILQKLKQAAASNFYDKIDKDNGRDTGRDTGRDAITSFETIAPPTPLRTAAPIQSLNDPGAGLPRFKAVAIGLSTGGPKTIFKVVPHLPAELDAAVFIIQHMPPAFVPPFAKRLNSKSRLTCVETEAGMTVKPGHVYIARGGSHLKLKRRSGGDVLIRQTQDPPCLFMPSVDIAMHSIYDVFRLKTIGVLMTGMGRDGADAMARITRDGGTTIAESEETAIVFGMPKEAIRVGGARIIAPHRDIAPEIIKAVGGPK